MKVLGLKMKTKNIVILLLAVVGAVYVVRKLMKTTEFFNAPYPQSHTNSSIIQEQKIEQQGGDTCVHDASGIRFDTFKT